MNVELNWLAQAVLFLRTGTGDPILFRERELEPSSVFENWNWNLVLFLRTGT